MSTFIIFSWKSNKNPLSPEAISENLTNLRLLSHACGSTLWDHLVLIGHILTSFWIFRPPASAGVKNLIPVLMSYYLSPYRNILKTYYFSKRMGNGWRVTTGSCLFLWDVGFQIFPEKRKYVSRHTEAFKMIDCLFKPWYFRFSLSRKWNLSWKFL